MRKMLFILFAGIFFWGCQKDDNNNNNDNNTNSGTVTDASGNTYPTVKIGNQIWMAENLRTTKYRDGSNIPVVSDNTQWSDNYNNSTTLPMMCWYNNDQATYTANKFGALYNWYAINPSTNGNKNICPNGWHIPTDAEWNLLIESLDPTYNPTAAGIQNTQSYTAGSKMKTTGTQYWQSPNTDATNSSGFSGLPGGFRTGYYLSVGNSGYWWSSTENNTFNSWYRYLNCTNGAVQRQNIQKQHGFSVRCIKD